MSAQGFDGSRFDHHGAPGTWVELIGSARQGYSLRAKASACLWDSGGVGWGLEHICPKAAAGATSTVVAQMVAACACLAFSMLTCQS